jgi:hypothetical protein
VKTNNKKIKKFRGGGGMDASQSDFKTPSSNPMSAGYSGAKKTSTRFNNTTNNNTNNNTSNNTNTTTKKSGSFKIPVVGPITAGLRLIQNLTTPKKEAHPFSANTIKQTRNLTTGNVDSGGGQNISLCPDGTNPPCKTPTTQIKAPANNFLSGFQSYDDGGEVVISSNVDKDLL